MNFLPKILILFVSVYSIAYCSSDENISKTNHMPNIIVLPAYDISASRGISPNISDYIVNALAVSKKFHLQEDIYKIFYKSKIQSINIYDKKYCTRIVDKFHPDIILMSKLSFQHETGHMSSDKWDFQIKAYNPKANKQIIILHGENITSAEIKETIHKNRRYLTTKILNLVSK